MVVSYCITIIGLPIIYALDQSLPILSGFTREWLIIAIVLLATILQGTALLKIKNFFKKKGNIQ